MTDGNVCADGQRQEENVAVLYLFNESKIKLNPLKIAFGMIRILLNKTWIKIFISIHSVEPDAAVKQYKVCLSIK